MSMEDTVPLGRLIRALAPALRFHGDARHWVATKIGIRRPLADLMSDCGTAILHLPSPRSPG